MKYIFAADIGGTAVKLGFFTEEGKLLRKWSIKTDTSENGKFILEDISREIKKQISSAGIYSSSIGGIGIGVPGPVTKDSEVNGCVALGWKETDVRQEMFELTGIRNIMVGNDANVAALGELYAGAAKGHESAVMVTLGTGVGGGIIENGRIVSGAFGAGGEIGHMNVNPLETEKCNCGNRGCLQQYASATGIVRRAERNMDSYRGETLMSRYENLTAKDVFDCAAQQDGLSMVTVDESMKILARALAMIAAVVDPEIFVIGGGVSAAGDMILDPLREYYPEYAFHASADTEIVRAKLGNDAGIFGACSLAIQNMKRG